MIDFQIYKHPSTGRIFFPIIFSKIWDAANAECIIPKEDLNHNSQRVLDISLQETLRKSNFQFQLLSKDLPVFHVQLGLSLKQ